MKATVDGVVYEGSEDEIRRIVENPPHRPTPRLTHVEAGWPPGDYPKNQDGSPKITS